MVAARKCECMSKSVLIIDEPKVCIDCPCHFAYDDGDVVCGAKGSKGRKLYTDDILTYKPVWCPLRHLPEPDTRAVINVEYQRGWNSYRSVLLGGQTNGQHMETTTEERKSEE